MKAFVYIILFALAAIFIKAFYFDSSSGKNENDVNVTQQEVAQEEKIEVKKAPLAEDKEANDTKKVNSGWGDKEKMPLDKLGDSIAEKIEDKI